MNEEKVYFTNKNELTLCGILSVPKKETEKCVILCHGLGGDKDEEGVFFDLSREMVERGTAVFRFDFTAHGESEGDSLDISVMREVNDIDAAVRFVQEKGYTKLGIVGASFGGGPVLLYAQQHKKLFGGIILLYALIDYDGMMNKDAVMEVEKNGYVRLGSLKVGESFVNDLLTLKPWQVLDEASSPVLFIHGDEDKEVPISESVKYAKMFDKTLVVIEGGAHVFRNNYTHELQATHAIIDFFDQHLV